MSNTAHLWLVHLRTSQAIALLLSMLIILIDIQSVSATQAKSKQKDLYRRSIVFDIKTPKVFYCPQEKQDLEKMLVKAKPLDNLCQYDGKTKPKSQPSDCYNDVDETQFACEEKRRFMLRLDSLSDTQDQLATTVNPADDLVFEDYIVPKDTGKKKMIYGKKT